MEDGDNQNRVNLGVAVAAAAHWLNDFLNDERAWEKVTVDMEEYRRMGDPAFQMHFRLSRPIFEELLTELGNHLVAAGRLIRHRTYFPDIVLMVLWIVATPDSFRSVALRFGKYPSEVHEHYKFIIEALRELGETYIVWPDQVKRNSIKAALQDKCGIPGIVGIVDGLHIYIPAPEEEQAAYRNYHHGHSIKAQVVCDHQLLVTDAYLGEAGSLHDARVFRRSPLCRNLLLRDDMFGPDELIIGDSAYPISDRLLTPFDNNGHLTPEQRNFNRRLSSVRCRIEHTFGHAQCMWRRLQYLSSTNMGYAIDHVAACLVLHNFKILHGDHVHNVHANPALEDGPFVGDRVQVQGVHDDLPDPHVPQGELARLFNEATILGEQNRWDICNRLPMD